MIPVHNFAKQNSLVSVFLNELRDIQIQKDSMRFRKNIERIGEIIAYEISKQLEFFAVEIETPLGISAGKNLSEQPVIATILRAGLPLHQGMLNYFDKAENAFISAYRKHHKNDTFEIEIEYLSSPSIQDKTLILTDPMLATGNSMVLAYKAMLAKGIPKHIHIVSVIASNEGINYIKKNMPPNTSVWVGAIDEELTAQAYIVPGLGDAGDLAYGAKI